MKKLLTFILFFLLIYACRAQVQTLFEGDLYAKSATECQLRHIRIGTKNEDTLLVLIDDEFYEFSGCIQEKKDKKGSYLCKDNCGSNYNIRIIPSEEGFIIIINNILSRDRYYLLSTHNVCE